MAIGTDSTIDFHGTQDEVTTTPAEVTDGLFSIASDTSIWPNDDDAPWAMFRLVLTSAGLGGAPAAGATVSLLARSMNIDGSTADQVAPQADFEHQSLGQFPVENQDINQEIMIGPIRLPNYKTSSEFEFYIKNNLGVTTGTGWELHVIPTTYGPHG